MNWQNVLRTLALRYFIALLAGAVSAPFWLLIAPRWFHTLGPGYTWTNWADFGWTLAAIPAVAVRCSLFLLIPFVAAAVILYRSSLPQTAVWGTGICYYVQLCFGFDVLGPDSGLKITGHEDSLFSFVLTLLVLFGLIPVLFALIVRWLAVWYRWMFPQVQ